MAVEVTTFKVGNLARLRSGGPVLTLQEFDPTPPARWVCVWFLPGADVLRTAAFAPSMLEPVESPPVKTEKNSAEK